MAEIYDYTYYNKCTVAEVYDYTYYNKCTVAEVYESTAANDTPNTAQTASLTNK